jgi:Zn-dependent protease with chaperone function
MRKPRVLVSDSTVELLSRDELRVALKHELAHIRSWDNLKKLMFRFSPFPGLTKLEAAWSQAAELAADDAAVSNFSDAIDLAAALVKLSRLIPVEAAPACTVGFVTGSLSSRVARLLAWDESGKSRQRRIPRWAAILPVAGTVFCAFATYGPALALTHEVTEWLVR